MVSVDKFSLSELDKLDFLNSSLLMTVGALGLSMFEIGTAEGAAFRLPHSRWDPWTPDQRRGGEQKILKRPSAGRGGASGFQRTTLLQNVADGAPGRTAGS